MRLWGSSLVALLMLLSACAKPPAPGKLSPLPVTEPAPAPVPRPEATPVAPSARTLFPTGDAQFTFTVTDNGKPSADVNEALIWNGDQLIGVYNGAPYVTWQFNSEGLWRLDPKGGGALLRFLPPTLKNVAWKQRSGDSDVWFHLATCPEITEPCWTLTTLNRGEKTSFQFLPGLGPTAVNAVNWQTPSASFDKSMNSRVPSKVEESQRTAYLAKVKPVSGTAAPVDPVTVDVFTEASTDAFLAFSTNGLRVDLNGDGQNEIVRGTLDTWNREPLEFFSPTGDRLGNFFPYRADEQHRAKLVRFKNGLWPAFLYEMGNAAKPHEVSIITKGPGPAQLTYGWAPKAPSTMANRAAIDETGLITVEWDMGDPARHTRTQQFRLTKREENWAMVSLVSTHFRSEGKELLYPGTHLELLQAAFFARWYGLTEELPRYFASPAAAAAFAADSRIQEPPYEPGSVAFATLVSPPAQDGTYCKSYPKEAKAEIGPNGKAPFLSRVGFYESSDHMWGTVTFGTVEGGRRVIQSLQIDGFCSTGV